MKNSLNSYDSLMLEWKTKRPNYEEFSDDGILINEIWKITSPKVMFLLKEPNSDFINIRGKGYLPRSGNSRLFWRNINIWQYTISEIWNNRIPIFEEAIKQKEKEVNSIAYVNLKKCNENISVSDPEDIDDYVVDDINFLQRQIELINPEVILCCRTMMFYKKLFNFEEISENVFRTNNRIIIDFFHPSCRLSYKESFTRLGNIFSIDKLKKHISQIQNLYDHTA